MLGQSQVDNWRKHGVSQSVKDPAKAPTTEPISEAIPEPTGEPIRDSAHSSENSIEVHGEVIATDPEGYLSDISQWSKAAAQAMAARDDIELTDSHWQVIEFLREYYDEFAFAPAVRILTRAVAKKLGKDKGNSRYLFQLFPQGPAKQACRYAGLPKPTGCI
jgi:tRNA 2-thiouridine synthesizing protein E